jgi:DNA-binding PucR family transcriptional regulator
VPLERAAGSIARAQAAFGLQESGVLPTASPLVTDAHLTDLLLHGDGALAADLAARALAPLAEVREGTRARLVETLRAWLDEPGQVSRVAERLHVHPQTVRYRMAQLRELFGERLDAPEARFELALALRVWRDDASP